jgi:hypothetical protein
MGYPFTILGTSKDTKGQPIMPNKKPSGRPVAVKVTLTQAQAAMLAAAAERAGMPLAIFVRSAAIEKAQRDAPASLPNG